MKLTKTLPLCAVLLALSACGSDEKTTVIREQPVVVAPAVSQGISSDDVEQRCQNGYDNRTRRCY